MSPGASRPPWASALSPGLEWAALPTLQSTQNIPGWSWWDVVIGWLGACFQLALWACWLWPRPPLTWLCAWR